MLTASETFTIDYSPNLVISMYSLLKIMTKSGFDKYSLDFFSLSIILYSFFKSAKHSLSTNSLFSSVSYFGMHGDI